jgi:hypothetical protein
MRDNAAGRKRRGRCCLGQQVREVRMQRTCLVLGLAVALGLAAPQLASAAGCLKGGAVGAVAGHEVGKGHAVAGAAAGCAIGHHEAKKKQQQSARGSGDGSGSSQAPNKNQK